MGLIEAQRKIKAGRDRADVFGSNSLLRAGTAGTGLLRDLSVEFC